MCKNLEPCSKVERQYRNDIGFDRTPSTNQKTIEDFRVSLGLARTVTDAGLTQGLLKGFFIEVMFQYYEPTPNEGKVAGIGQVFGLYGLNLGLGHRA